MSLLKETAPSLWECDLSACHVLDLLDLDLSSHHLPATINSNIQIKTLSKTERFCRRKEIYFRQNSKKWFIEKLGDLKAKSQGEETEKNVGNWGDSKPDKSRFASKAPKEHNFSRIKSADKDKFIIDNKWFS